MENFSHEFVSGNDARKPLASLGRRGKQFALELGLGNAGKIPHLLVMFFAESGRLDAFIESATRSNLE